MLYDKENNTNENNKPDNGSNKNVLDKDDSSIEYEDAKQMVLEALKPMGEDYVDALKYAFDNRWLDVYERKNKIYSKSNDSALY